MLYFPQLESGATSQFPGGKQLVERTVINKLENGGTLRLGDPDEARIEWVLKYEDLSDGEMAAIATLFEACEGRLHTFVFLDPYDNLLDFSEDPGADVWRKDPMIEIAYGAADPLGTHRAVRITNLGQAPQRLDQTLSAPEGLQYCFSFYARSDSGAQVIPYRTAGGTADRRMYGTGMEWRRIAVPSKLGSAGETATFGIELAPGATVDVFGLQVEAQAGTSRYKPTTSRGGVYPRARFVDDTLTVVKEGVNRHSCCVRVTARKRN